MALIQITKLLTSGIIKGLDISFDPRRRGNAIPLRLGLKVLLPENVWLPKLTESGPGAGEGVSGLCDISWLSCTDGTLPEETFKREKKPDHVTCKYVSILILFNLYLPTYICLCLIMNPHQMTDLGM